MATTRFDQMFHAMFDGDEMNADTCVEPTPPPVQAAPSTLPDLEREVRAALGLFYAGHYARCLSAVRSIASQEDADPRVAALLGACSALVSGRLRPGIDACAGLLSKAFYQPDIYCALGVLLLKSRRRGQAMKVCNKGLKLDPNHPGLQRLHRDLGVRRQPVLAFLRRSHPANRVLGALRSHISAA